MKYLTTEGMGSIVDYSTTIICTIISALLYFLSNIPNYYRRCILRITYPFPLISKHGFCFENELLCDFLKSVSYNELH